MVDFTQARVTMVDTQVRPSDVTRLPVIEAMLTIPRDAFVPASLRPMAYSGQNLPLGEDRILLDPRTLAKMVDAIAPEPGDLILDLGCGTGYATAILAAMAQAVVGIESDPARAAEAQETLAGLGVDNAAVITAPLTEGAPAQGPYDALLVSGGAIEDLPAAIVTQLREGARLAAVFMENNLGVVRFGLVHKGKVTWRDAFNASAPLLAEFTSPRGFVF